METWLGLGFGVFTLLFCGTFLLVFGIILFVIIKGVAQWSHDNSQPVVTVPCRVVAKRTSTSSPSGGMVSTHYFVTFEFDETGDRREFSLSGNDFGLLVEGDQGLLTHQGSRYRGFERRRA